MKFSGEVDMGHGTNPLNFGDDPDPDPDSGSHNSSIELTYSDKGQAIWKPGYAHIVEHSTSTDFERLSNIVEN